jgi:hypothetical protein
MSTPTWTYPGTLPFSDASSVTFGVGTFVAVNETATDNVAYSLDVGATWTMGTLPGSVNGWSFVFYAGGLFVAFPYAGSGAAYSSDGISWTATPMPYATPQVFQAAYSTDINLWVAVSGDGNSATSPDGITWSTGTSGLYGDPQCVCWGNGLFIFIGQGVPNGASSADGVTWSYFSLPRNGGYICGAGGGAFVGGLASDTDIGYSTDAITWVDIGTIVSEEAIWDSMCFASPGFVIVASTSGGGHGAGAAAYSPDGLTWVDTGIDNHGWVSVTYGAGVYMVVASTGQVAVSATSSPQVLLV